MIGVRFFHPPAEISPHEYVTYEYGPILNGRFQLVLQSNTVINAYLMTPEDANRIPERDPIRDFEIALRGQNRYAEMVSIPPADLWTLVLVNPTDEPAVVYFEVYY